MAILIQSLSWTLIYSLGQGLMVYAALWLLLKLVPSMSSNAKYHLSLSALTILLAWFAGTWWQQYHSISLANEHTLSSAAWTTITIQQLQASGIIDNHSWYRSLVSSIDTVFPWLPVCYFAGLVLMLVRLSGGMLQIFALRRRGLEQVDAVVEDLMGSLKKNLHIEGGVQLFVSARAHVPMVIGFFKPMILMPAAVMAQLNMEQLETILLHELAHIKRQDYLVNILQTVVETVLFFNPFVWAVSSITRREREHCCDDLVLEHSREPLSYATALAALANNEGTAASFSIAASGQSNHLYNRIKRIMEMKKNPFSYSRTAAAILIITAITCSIAWLTPSFAEPKKARHSEATVSKTTPVKNEVMSTNVAAAQPKKEAAPATKHQTTGALHKTETTAVAGTGTSTPLKKVATAENQEELQLITALGNDGVIDEITGYVVEKKQDKLFINGKQVSDAMASKYMSGLRKDEMRIQVYPFLERLKQHPNNSFIQNLIPVTLSSPCVVFKPKKDGC